VVCWHAGSCHAGSFFTPTDCKAHLTAKIATLKPSGNDPSPAAFAQFLLKDHAAN